MKTKAWVLVFLFICSCTRNNYSGLKWASFFKRSVNCKKTHKTILNKQKLSKKQKKSFEKKINQCLQKGEEQQAILIMERLLKILEKQGAEQTEKIKWEKKIAEQSFFKIKNYEKALKYYVKILKRPLEPKENFMIQYHIAESFFYLKKYTQALRELEKCFFEGISKEQTKLFLVLKARIFMAQKQFSLALRVFERQIESFPEEEVFFREYLALIYETKKDLLSAVGELKKISHPNSFIQEKIRRLTERQTQQPGIQ